MQPVAFTPVTAADAADFFALFVRVRGHDLGAAAWPEPLRATTLGIQFEAQRRGYAERHPGADTLFLARGGERVGWAIVDRGAAAWLLVDIAVAPEARGQGIGGEAVRALQAGAAAAGVPLMLSVARDNAGAARLYARLGFTPAGADDTHLRLTWQPPSTPSWPA
jgi:ribosomal protein S18 acetylase RimI-like enzyme